MLVSPFQISHNSHVQTVLLYCACTCACWLLSRCSHRGPPLWVHTQPGIGCMCQLGNGNPPCHAHHADVGHPLLFSHTLSMRDGIHIGENVQPFQGPNTPTRMHDFSFLPTGMQRKHTCSLADSCMLFVDKLLHLFVFLVPMKARRPFSTHTDPLW